MKKIISIALLLCWLVPAGVLANPPTRLPEYIQLVVFGDSFSDSGNNALVFGTKRTPVPLIPPDIIPTAPYQSDRYSNGHVWAEQLADELGLMALASRGAAPTTLSAEPACGSTSARPGHPRCPARSLST
ncbi:MAG: SGNH/GDSL hydrolase family protein [Nitrococcus sp.]|nr:SGNH/GDSL hydrolase family protein [Nitrococcus sp.]